MVCELMVLLFRHGDRGWLVDVEAKLDDKSRERRNEISEEILFRKVSIALMRFCSD